MRIIHSDNYWVQLEFDSEEQRESMVRQTSYYVPGYERSTAYLAGRWTGLKSYLTPANKLPKGLFKSIFNKHSLVYDNHYEDLSFSDIPLYMQNSWITQRDYQLNAVNSAFRNQRGILSLTTGSGKTMISAAIASKHLSESPTNKLLFVCYDINILQQTIKNYAKLGFNVTQYSGTVKDLSGDVIVGTIQSLSRITQPRKVLKNISFVIVDEVHHSKSKTSKDVLTKLPNCNYYIGLTATPHKEKSLALAELMSVIGPVIYEYGYTDAVNQDSIVPVKAFFLKSSISYEQQEKLMFRKNYKVIWDYGIKDNIKRNKLVATLNNTILDLLNTTNLIVVDRVEHGNNILQNTELLSHTRALASFGKDSVLVRDYKKEALMNYDINTLVSNILFEGVDFEISPVVSINASGRQGFIKIIQSLGRITRKNEKFKSFRIYCDFIDRFHPVLTQHSNERMNTCREHGIEVVECDTLNDMLCEIIKHYKQCMAEN